MKKYKIKKAGIFGSYSRGEQKGGSDIDILIQRPEGMSLFDLSGLKIELEEALKRNVDIVTYKYIHPLIRDSVLEDEVKIL